MKKFFRNFGLLEILVTISFTYVLCMLIWTASTRSKVENNANSVKENHIKVVNFLNNEINKCSQNKEGKTIWGEQCINEWESKIIIDFIIKNMKLENPYNNNKFLIQSANDPRIQAEGKAGQSTDKGIIFISSSNFLSEPGSEWIIGTCIKSPCVAAGNNELTSVYR
mgnify:CR=1 FL=1